MDGRSALTRPRTLVHEAAVEEVVAVAAAMDVAAEEDMGRRRAACRVAWGTVPRRRATVWPRTCTLSRSTVAGGATSKPHPPTVRPLSKVRTVARGQRETGIRLTPDKDGPNSRPRTAMTHRSRARHSTPSSSSSRLRTDGEDTKALPANFGIKMSILFVRDVALRC